MYRLFQFLDLAMDDDSRARMQVSIGIIAGGTPKETVAGIEDKGYLTASAIREAVERLLPEVTAQLAQGGVDSDRLRLGYGWLC